MEQYDVIVVGAGAAGLMAAMEIALTGKKTCILEARDRTGGRIHTITDVMFSKPVEMGAEFVHGDLKNTTALLKKGGIKHYKLGGSMWQKHEGQFQEQKYFVEDYSTVIKKLQELKEDIPVRRFLDEHLADEKYEQARFTLQNYVEGYYAADSNFASSFSMRDELTQSGDVQYRIEGGYIKMIELLQNKLEELNVPILLSQQVTEVKWSKNDVEVTTPLETFNCKKILFTVPIGVLQSESIQFSPNIPVQITAVKELGFGIVIKIVIEFDEAFWKNKKYSAGKNLADMLFLFSEEKLPTWWTQHPGEEPILTGWAGGPDAQKLAHLSEQQLLETALQALANIFNSTFNELQQMMVAHHVINWSKEKYSCGAYSYEVVDGLRPKQILNAGVDDTIFFAGEGLHIGPEIGTVEAALFSGKERAHQLIASFV